MNYPVYPDLGGKRVFITGGGSGIGAVLVEAFLSEGCKVGFVSLNGRQGEELCERLERELGARALFTACDVRDIGHLHRVMDEFVRQWGALDVLINNAARDDRHSLNGMTVDTWDDSLDTNLRPYFFTTQKAAESMRKQGGGAIIQMGSNAGILGLSGYPAYVTAKAGIIGLTRALARELGGDNIRVNALIPGWVMTPKQLALWATPEEVAKCLAEQCLKTTIEAEDIANAALFLASGVSRMMTAQSLIIDGGRA